MPRLCYHRSTAMDTATLTALPPGTLLADRFEIEVLLNAGGFSLIYRALDHETGRSIVLKECAPEGMVHRDETGQIIPASAEAADVMQRVEANARHEAQVLAMLTAAGVGNITSYIADFDAFGAHFIAMEKAPGYTLHQWAQGYRDMNTPFPAECLEGILTAVLSILGQVHACGIYHCDIKPSNILINEEGAITLIDFGAVRTAEQQHDGTEQVSPGFTPPEFYPSHRAQIGPWTDIYMLAALFYDIIAGHAPEPANERAVVDRTPRLSANPELHAIYRDSFLISIDKALSLDIHDRFASAELWQVAYSSMKAAPRLRRSLPSAQGKARPRAQLHRNNNHGPLASGALTLRGGELEVTPLNEYKSESSGGSWGFILFIITLLLVGAIVAQHLGYL